MPELDVVAADKGHVEPFARTLVPVEFAGGSDPGVTAAQDQDIVREVVDCHWRASLEGNLKSGGSHEMSPGRLKRQIPPVQPRRPARLGRVRPRTFEMLAFGGGSAKEPPDAGLVPYRRFLGQPAALHPEPPLGLNRRATHFVTVMVPTIEGWIEQRYAIVPIWVKVTTNL